MVIVSPYAKAGFVDSSVASYASVLAFTEHVFGLRSLNGVDGNAYDYSDSFDFAGRPLPPVPLPRHAVPPGSQRFIRTHPPNPNEST